MTEVRDDVADAYDRKRSKPSVDYSRGHPTGDHCGVCEHYAAHRCELVAGEIDPAFWCKLFERKAQRS